MPFLPPNCMVHDCLFIYIAAGRHIWRSFPYPLPGDAAGSLQKGPKMQMPSLFIKGYSTRYSPDLVELSDFCWFPLLKTHQYSTQFSSDSDVIESVENFLHEQDELFYKTESQKPQKQQCIEVCGDYVENSTGGCCCIIVSLYI